MRRILPFLFGVAVLASIASVGASAEAANNCKASGDHHKRCMANYPGPTYEIDYDICQKSCGKK